MRKLTAQEIATLKKLSDMSDAKKEEFNFYMERVTSDANRGDADTAAKDGNRAHDAQVIYDTIDNLIDVVYDGTNYCDILIDHYMSKGAL